MKETPNVLDFKEDEKLFNIIEVFLKYLRYWPWILVVSIISIALGYGYTQLVPKTYETVAKIKILDATKELSVMPEGMAVVGGNSKINLDNQIEVLRSYRLLHNVVTDLHLDIAYYKVENFMTTEIWNPPFIINKIDFTESDGNSEIYEVVLSTVGFNITSVDGKKFVVPFNKSDASHPELPFSIRRLENTNIENYKPVVFKVILQTTKDVCMELGKNLQVQAASPKSDIVILSLKGQSKERSEAILNAIIKKFDQDGITDRQLVSKRTLEVIDKRFVYLSGELDSIEMGKQGFKQANNLSYIEADAGLSLQQKANTESEVYKLETQISLSKLLQETVTNEAEYSLLPAEIGLSNSSLNGLVAEYNQLAQEREKLEPTVGVNHPTLQALSNQLELAKLNILNTVNVYKSQLGISLSQLNQQKNLAGARFNRIPEKEKILRSIERQQGIKESLFLLLLQKREEAAINYAVTEPSIKVIDYGITSKYPIWPKKSIILPVALALGMLPLFSILFVRFSLDTKIHDRSAIERMNPEIPFLGEIPFLRDNKKFIDANDRSVLAESFRILSTNANFLLTDKNGDQGKVIFVTSSIKGEGKTLLAINFSLAFASMEKRVLLVGADLRNPQLHSYFDIDKNTPGLTDYLSERKVEFTDYLHKGFGQNSHHKVYFSGTVPSNAPVLLSGQRFQNFMETAKKEFDYIIVDTAPTMLVTDTLVISNFADLTLYILRADFTDKRLLEFSKGLNRSGKLNDMAYVFNAVGSGKSKDYNYGYGYGYGEQKVVKSRFNKKSKKRDPQVK